MKKIYKNRGAQQDAYRERVSAKKDFEGQYKALNLCSFAETAFETPAKTCVEEIQVHRQWLRALEESDVQPHETLRQLAKRTWDALLNSKGFGVITDGADVWHPCFQPSKQHFQIPFDSIRFPGGPLGETIKGGAEPGWFDAHWAAPNNCTGDEPISVKDLPPLPPMPRSHKAA